MEELCRHVNHSHQQSIGTVLLDLRKSSWSRHFMADLEAAFPDKLLFSIPQDEGFDLGHLLRKKPAYLIMDAPGTREGCRRLQSQYAALCHALPGLGVVFIVDTIHDGDLLRLVSMDLRGILHRSDTNEQFIAALRSIFFGYVLIKRISKSEPSQMGKDKPQSHIASISADGQHRQHSQFSHYGQKLVQPGLSMLDDQQHRLPLHEDNDPAGKSSNEAESYQDILPADVEPHSKAPAHELERLYLLPTHEVGRLSILSPREREIVRLVSMGYGSRVIGHQLILSEGRVKNILTEIYLKLGVSSRKGLAELVLQEGD